jgi:uncharacterized protein involved in exopolysaccharide biosynthesis
MQEQTIQQQTIPPLDFWRVIGKRKKLIFWLTIATALTTAVCSLFMQNIYEAKAVITTVSERDTSSSAAMEMLGASGLGSMADIAGVALPGGQKLILLESYLKSNIVREKVIVKNDLLPVLFRKRWDAEKKEWKQAGFLTRALRAVSRAIGPDDKTKGRPGGGDNPTVSDGLRLFDKMVTVKSNVKANTLTVIVDYRDPVIAADLVTYILDELQDHVSEEKKRSANENRDFLKGQLVKAVEPITRQKIYSLLSKQIETALMAEVKGNIFNIIDPPRVPDRKVKPERTLLVILSVVISLFIGVYLALFLEKREQFRISRQKKQAMEDRGQ